MPALIACTSASSATPLRQRYTRRILKESSCSAGPMLVDPMCGSGTFLIEGALMATNAAPGLLRRRWPFERWPDFEPAAWQQARAAAAAARDLGWDGQLLGNDVHDGALSLAVRCVFMSCCRCG